MGSEITPERDIRFSPGEAARLQLIAERRKAVDQIHLYAHRYQVPEPEVQTLIEMVTDGVGDQYIHDVGKPPDR